MAKAKRAQNRAASIPLQPVAPPAAIPVTTLGASEGFPIATGDAPDLPRPPMRVLSADPIPAAVTPAPVGVSLIRDIKEPPPVAVIVSTKLVSVLMVALHAAERAGRSKDSAVLNAVVVPLSEAIVKSQLPVDDPDVRALLDKISNL